MPGTTEDYVVLLVEVPVEIDRQWIYPLRGVQVGAREKQAYRTAFAKLKRTDFYRAMGVPRERLDMIVAPQEFQQHSVVVEQGRAGLSCRRRRTSG